MIRLSLICGQFLLEASVFKMKDLSKEENLLLILGNQLFPIDFLNNLKIKNVFMREDVELCTYVKHHKMKIYLFLCSMREYRDLLKKNNYHVTYEKLDDPNNFKKKYIESLKDHIKKNNIKRLFVFDIVDKFFNKQIMNLSNHIEIKLIKSPMFMLEINELENFYSNNKNLRMVSFYQMMRKKFNLLIDIDQKPIGGKWSFDDMNRKPIPKDEVIPKNPNFNESYYSKDIKLIINDFFKSHPGQITNLWFPTNRSKALRLLDEFIKLKFKKFGDYEDAINSNDNFLYHSCLSSSLNLGLITPIDIIDKVKNLKNIPLNSLEGFIRQIIGWREFIRLVYHLKSEMQEKENFWKHKRKLKNCWYEGTTGIPPLDDSIKNCLKYGYVHHIPRLMILSNIMNLCKISPDEIHKWFMEMFIDSSDWVMGPNVYGMGTFADGGVFSTKPYICGSNYILKMSNYKKNNWCNIMDGLYWSFISNNRGFFSKNPRLNMMIRTLDRMNDERKKIIFKQANEFIEKVSYI